MRWGRKLCTFSPHQRAATVSLGQNYPCDVEIVSLIRVSRKAPLRDSRGTQGFHRWCLIRSPHCDAWRKPALAKAQGVKRIREKILAGKTPRSRLLKNFDTDRPCRRFNSTTGPRLFGLYLNRVYPSEASHRVHGVSHTSSIPILRRYIASTLNPNETSRHNA